jgi:hypothetical protein
MMVGERIGWRTTASAVMPGLVRLVPGIHALRGYKQACPRANNTTTREPTSPGAWLAGTSPAMTSPVIPAERDMRWGCSGPAEGLVRHGSH